MAFSHRWKVVGDRHREVPAQLQAELSSPEAPYGADGRVATVAQAETVQSRGSSSAGPQSGIGTETVHRDVEMSDEDAVRRLPDRQGLQPRTTPSR